MVEYPEPTMKKVSSENKITGKLLKTMGVDRIKYIHRLVNHEFIKYEYKNWFGVFFSFMVTSPDEWIVSLSLL